MGAHSSPSLHQNPSTNMIDSREVSLTRDERGYLKELLRTYKFMFAEQMTAQRFSMTTDMQKRQQYMDLQQSYAEHILTKLLASEAQ